MEKAHIDISTYESLVGIPYKRKCFDGTGFDCWSLVHHIYLMNDIELPRNILDGWSVRKMHRRVEEQRVTWIEVGIMDRRALDVLLFATSYRLRTHVGLVINSKYFIHAHSSLGVVIEKFNRGIFSSMISKVYRWQQ